MHHHHLGVTVAKASICHVFKTMKRELIKRFAEIPMKYLPQVCFVPFDVLEGNQITQARLDFNERLQASKDHYLFSF
jgi:hypothetical protein